MKVVVLTGAGISAESGVPTFRDADGLWEGHRVEDVATPEAFGADPETVHKFYDARRAALGTVGPNAAHTALAELEVHLGDDLLLVTQNIDDLHERAGSKRVMHMHGKLRSAVCVRCGGRVTWDGPMIDAPPCATCGQGAAQPVDRVDGIVAGLDLGELEVEARDLFVKDSSALTTADQALIVREVRTALEDPAIDGVVVTHGTDTAEETAYLLDLVHADDRPIVLTGAQRPADAPDADGPRNLQDALSVAADPAARGLGVLVVFDGLVLAARGTRKVHTREAAAFAQTDGPALGRVVDGRLVVAGVPAHRERLDIGLHDIEALRVDIAAVYPGVDGTALEAFAAAGARGVVLVATGSGNANPAIVAAVADLTRQGVVVGLTTRVDTGPVSGIYGGGGGGADLVVAGAVPLGTLRAGQGRILLLALLATVGDPDRVREALPAYL